MQEDDEDDLDEDALQKLELLAIEKEKERKLAAQRERAF